MWFFFCRGCFCFVFRSLFFCVSVWFLFVFLFFPVFIRFLFCYLSSSSFFLIGSSTSARLGLSSTNINVPPNQICHPYVPRVNSAPQIPDFATVRSIFYAFALSFVFLLFPFVFLSTGGWGPLLDGRTEGRLLTRSPGVLKQGCFAAQSWDSDHLLPHQHLRWDLYGGNRIQKAELWCSICCATFFVNIFPTYFVGTDFLP